MQFKPCIDLHNGRVKQIVGSSLVEGAEPQTHFVSEKRPRWYAQQYKKDGLEGGHVIRLGPGNDAAAREVLETWPGGFQIGGGLSVKNAQEWLETGASHIIVTSCLFRNCRLDPHQLDMLLEAVPRERLVFDLSCRKKEGVYHVVIDRWQTFTSLEINARTLEKLAPYCSEFLVHSVDMEGKRQGMDEELVRRLADCSPLPCVYAGGIRGMEDLEKLNRAGAGRIDFTVGSALDMFGGTLPYREVVEYCRNIHDAARRKTM